MYSNSINELIKSFKRLPGIGQKTAERFVFYLLKSGKKEVSELEFKLKNLIKEIQSCQQCWNFSDQNPCPICANKNRDKTVLCVVAEPQDIPAIEKTNQYHGCYHVLRGLLSSEVEIEEQSVKIQELFERLKENTDIKEVILALNPDMAGETTMLYLQKQISQLQPEIKITKLARGLPMNSDLQYADEITLSAALKNRQ